MPVSFGGRQYYKPGAYSIVDTANMSVLQVGNQKVLMLIGSANGGQPGQVMYFNDVNQARKTLRGGDLLNGASFAWAPSKQPGIQGADVIGVYRTDTAVQATLALKDTNATPATFVTLTATIYGTDGNQLTAVVSAGTASGNKVVLSDPMGILPTEIYDNMGTPAALAAAINAGSQIATAVAGTSVVSMATGTFTFAGATQTAGTTTAFQNALTALQGETIDGIVALTANQAIQAMVQSHVDLMSSTQWKKERRAFAGSAIGDSIATSTANAQAINDSRMAYVYPGVYRYDAATKAKTLMAGYLTACGIAGIWAGQDPKQSVTFKYLDVLQMEVNLQPPDIETLLQAGVIPVEKATDGFRIVQGVTTFNQTSTTNLAAQLLEVASVIDAVTLDFRSNMQKKFTGNPGTSTTPTEMMSYGTTLLNNYVTKGWLVAGQDPVTGLMTLPPYQGLTVTQSGNAYSASYQARPSVEVDYELITEHFSL